VVRPKFSLRACSLNLISLRCFAILRNFDIAVLLLVGFLFGCGRSVNPGTGAHNDSSANRDPHSSPDAYFNSDRPSENDTFPDTDAVSPTDALSKGHSHAYSKSLRQRQSQLNSYAHSALPPSAASPPPRKSHVVTHLIITPGRLDFFFALRVLRVGMNTPAAIPGW
jgi:hypothetical protein